MIVWLLFACLPTDGGYLMQTDAWSTNCTVGTGPYSEPASQYAVELLVDSDDLWLDEHHCRHDGVSYTCDDEPVVSVLGGGYEATVTVRRAWTGDIVDQETITGKVDWTSDCAGADCNAITALGIELCDAAWAYSAVAVSWD